MGWNADSAADPGLAPALENFARNLSLSGTIAAWSILAATTTGLVLMVAIIVLNLVNSRRSRRFERLRKEWLGILITPGSRPGDLDVADQDIVPFLKTWLQLLESLRGEYREQLVSFLRRSPLTQKIRDRLRKGGVAERILCMEALGTLRDSFCIKTLEPLVQQPDPVVSLHAATTLVSINPQDWLPELLPHFLWRADWPLSRVHAHLREAPQHIVGENLERFIHLSKAACPPRALRLISLLPHESHSRILNELLDPHIVLPTASECTLLAAIKDPGMAHFARDRIRHPNWPITLAAVRALGRVGNLDDIPLFTDLLDHPQWWVRYRAAGALAALPQLKPIQIELLAASHPDPLVGDMLRFALAERSLA